MIKMKKTLAVAMAAVMLVPATAMAAPSPQKTDLKGAKAAKTATYTGKKAKLTIKVGGKTLKEGKDFKVVKGTKRTNAGKVTVKVQGIGNYTGTYTYTLTIKKAKKPVVVLSSKATKALKAGFKAKDVKKKTKKINLSLKKAGATVTKVSVSKKAGKKLVASKGGVITAKKGLKKGTYKVTFTIKKTKNYAGGKVAYTVKVK